MHKNLFKPGFIAGTSKFSTKPLTILLTHIKEGLQSTAKQPTKTWGQSDVDPKELLEYLKSLNFNHITNIKSFDFSTLYQTISHHNLKSRLATMVLKTFIHKNWKSQIQILGFRSRGTLFVKEKSDFKKQEN